MIRCAIAMLLVVCLLPGCQQTAQPQQLRLRILTYNIHHGQGTDGEFDYQRLADIIKRAEPDLVALQEVDVKTKRSNGVDQAATLAELTGMHHYFVEAMPYQGGSYGVAILSRFPATPGTHGSLALIADPGQEPRAVAVASFRPDQYWPTIDFSSTHLCHLSADTRLRQVKQINDELIGHPDWIQILAGDFNFTPDSPAYRELTEQWDDAALIFGDQLPTTVSDNPRERIDYVFVRTARPWRVVEARVIDEPIASDHRPVLVVLEYVPPQ